MEQSARKEVVQLNGLTILVVIALIANFLIVGFFYRFHNYQLFVVGKKHNLEMKALLDTQHALHQEIIALEGVKTWNDTAYMKKLDINQLDK